MTTSPATLRSTASRARSYQVRYWSKQILLYGSLLFGVVLTGMPFLYMFTASLKANAEIFAYPLTIWPQQPILTNYQRLLSGESIPFIRQFVNSLIVAFSQVALSLFVASLVGWGFAKYEFRGKQVLFLILLGTLMVPGQVTLVPLFLLMLNIGWLDTYWAIIIPGAVNAFGVFFMRQNMLSVPNELLDAGRIDGVSEFGLYWRIGLPLTRGALSILSVLTFLGAWNDYLWPLIVLRSSERFTYPLGLATLNGLYRVEYGMILAGATIVTIPVILVFIAGRNHLISSLTIGAVKG